MPTLNWIGKEKVINHHLDIPYKILDHKYSFDENGQHAEDNDSENKIIRGDNLEALKALLPQYEGKIKCIYIDPPYNTGNEKWAYNDNVNDPKIKKWLGEVVGKEGEDLSRHDKWLCMMYPRLKLLHKLLSDDGAIFISIDDNEQANLKLICDEIFGANCYISNISWQRTYSPRNDSKGISNEIEHMLVYCKNIGWIPNKLPRTAKMNSKYKNIDNDFKPWRTSDAFAPGASTHQGMVYAIQHPVTGKLIYPYNGACWPLRQSDMLLNMSEWGKYELKDLDDAAERAVVCGISRDEIRQGVMGIVLAEPLENSRARAKEIYKRGQWPKFFFTKKGEGGIARKTYLDDTDGRVVTNLWSFEEAGHTDAAKKELKAIFDNKKVFDTPKPSKLIERIINISTEKDSIILDSFAGSGTTAHAILNMNKSDGGNRKFILIEMEDYAESITAERVKRVIDGYGDVDGTGGSFSFYDLGEPMLIDNEYLNVKIPVTKIKEYVYFMETRKVLYNNSNSYYLDTHNNTAYYFYYEKESVTTLNYSFLKTIMISAENYVIYADICTLSEEELLKYNITFKKIPRDIARL